MEKEFFERIIGMGLLSDVFGLHDNDRLEQTSRIVLADENGQRSGENIIFDINRSFEKQKLTALEDILKKVAGYAQELERNNRELLKKLELEKSVSEDRRRHIIALNGNLDRKEKAIRQLEEKKARATVKLTRAHEELAGLEMVFDRVVAVLLEMVGAKGTVAKKKIKSVIDTLLPPSAGK